MKKVMSIVLAAMISFGVVSSVSFADRVEKSKVNNNSRIKEEIFIKGDGEKVELTEAEKRESREKEEKILKESNSIRSLVFRSASSNEVTVANARQEKSYYCGPATAYNIIWGDYIGRYLGSYSMSARSGKQVPSQSQLSDELGTTEAGTNFGTNFSNVLRSYMYNRYVVKWGDNNWINNIQPLVKSTIDKQYGVVANINHRYLGSKAIHPAYAYSAAHYITVYAYDSKGVMISDSNGSIAKRRYHCTWEQLAKSTKARGIIY